MSATATANGKPRKQLSDQLDRLDRILDAFGEALPEAVIDACRDGAKTAVKEALIEILTNPELRSLLVPTGPLVPVPQPPSQEPVPARRSFWSRVKARIAAAAATIRSAARTLATIVPIRNIVVAATAVGAATAFVVRMTPTVLSGALVAVGDTIAAGFAWVRRQFQRPVPACSVCPT
jgi:hypothetical protein